VHTPFQPFIPRKPPLFLRNFVLKNTNPERRRKEAPLILLQYTSESSCLNHSVDLSTCLKLILRCVAHCCSGDAYPGAAHAFPPPYDFRYSSDLPSLSPPFFFYIQPPLLRRQPPTDSVSRRGGTRPKLDGQIKRLV